jgi:hypothetical protein
VHTSHTHTHTHTHGRYGRPLVGGEAASHTDTSEIDLETINQIIANLAEGNRKEEEARAAEAARAAEERKERQRVRDLQVLKEAAAKGT